MKKLFNILKMLLIFFPLFHLSVFSQVNNFVEEQKEYSKVRTAYVEKETKIKAALAELGLELSEIHILITAFKNEKELDLWVKRKSDKVYNKLKTYNICRTSGHLGPKRREGDLQIPEGFYYINVFNPSSNFYLSLGINYPNRSDRILSPYQDPGSAIFIHGSCVTIGCLPMTDNIIKELYVFAVEAKNNDQDQIPVYLFPMRLNDNNFKCLKSEYSDKKILLDFWENIKKGYDMFILTKEELRITIGDNGKYFFES